MTRATFAIVLACASTFAATRVPVAVSTSDPASKVDPTLVLTRIVETRERVIAAAGDGGFHPFDEPGLRLTFRLTPPDGLRLLGVSQPSELVAVDSSGADLADIEPGFGGEREYLSTSMVHFFGDEEEQDPGADVSLRLAPSTRAAATCTVAATFDAEFYAGLKDVTLSLGDAWTAIDADAVGGLSVRARFRPMEGFGGESWGLEVSPAEASRLFDSVEVEYAGDTSDSEGSISDGRTISYFFTGGFEEGEPVEARFRVRTGLQTFTLHIREEDVDLP